MSTRKGTLRPRTEERHAMTNQDVLSAFQEYLDSPPTDERARLLSSIIGDSLSRQDVLNKVREYALVIDPVPLAETTIKEMRVFVADGKKGLGSAISREIEHYRRYVAMEVFRCFRDSVLKKKPKAKS